MRQVRRREPARKLKTASNDVSAKHIIVSKAVFHP
jgi:hypothetical protein